MELSKTLKRLPRTHIERLEKYGNMTAIERCKEEYQNKIRGYLQCLHVVGIIDGWEEKALFMWYAIDRNRVIEESEKRNKTNSAE